MNRAGYTIQPEPVRASLIILPCPTCGRAVQVFGRMRRVLCACGETLMEIQGKGSSTTTASASPSGVDTR